MPEKLNEVLYRDDAFAKREVLRGMHHTMYFRMVIAKLLKQVGVDFAYIDHDACVTGAYLSLLTDPVTNLTYEVMITPRLKRKAA